MIPQYIRQCTAKKNRINAKAIFSPREESKHTLREQSPIWDFRCQRIPENVTDRSVEILSRR